jgi:N4-gp56 family major capsid protein
MDDVTLAVIANATTGGTKRYAGGAATYAALDALTPANGKITSDDVLNALTALRIAKAPKIGGEYIGIAGPRVLRDIMDDTTWVNAKSYSDVDGLYKGEAGMFFGVRFVMTTNEWCEKATEGTRLLTPAADSNWLTVFTGKQGYGVVHLDGMSPFSPSVMICDKPEKVDPANQYMTAAWKAYYQAAMLDATWVVALRSKSTFGS